MRRAMNDPDVTRCSKTTAPTPIDYDITGTPGFVINGELVPGFNEPLLGNAPARSRARSARTPHGAALDPPCRRRRRSSES